MSIKGQRAVVIGGTSGIGLAAAQALVSEGAHVVIASRSTAKLEQAKRLLGNVEAHELDFRKESQLDAFFNKVGHFNHLIVTAGDGAMGTIDELPVENVRQAFDSKFWGQYLAAKASIPYLDKAGSITFTSGVYAVRPPKGVSTISAINSAIEGLARGLAVDLAPIRVNVVSPGIIDTPIYSGMPDTNRTAMFEGIAQQLPVRRVGQPEDVGQTFLYVVKNGFTTGTVIPVDGGALLA